MLGGIDWYPALVVLVVCAAAVVSIKVAEEVGPRRARRRARRLLARLASHE